MIRSRYLKVLMLACSMLVFCSCSKERKKPETVNVQDKEIIEEAESTKQRGENTEQGAVLEEAAESLEQGIVIDQTAEGTEQERVIDSELEKGYDLPVADQDREEAEQDSYRLMTLLTHVYINADKGDSSNVVLNGSAMRKMTMKIKEQGYPVIRSEIYSNMENYQEVETFLTNAKSGNKGSVVIYEVHSDGGIGREKYVFDGRDMFLLASNIVWGDDNKPSMSFISYTRLKEWRYSDKGWFCYELCVPEYPEVTEMVDGSCLIRIKPMSRKKRRLSKQCVQVLGYQGNNLLCSNWDENHLENLDYNGLYEYFYEMKYKKKYKGKKYPDGIPKDEFESLMMEYLPVTSELIQKHAAFNKKNNKYSYRRLGCFNYVPDCFDTSTPEVTRIRNNSDGTITLTVDAVCEMMLCDEAVITHELTVRFAKDGSFRYISNKILNGGIKDIPEYQYRF